MSTARPPSPSAAPATIASAQLPPRVRKILQEFFTHISPDIVNALNAMLPAFEQQLFKQAEQARSNSRQAEQFAILRTFQRNRGELVPHFMFGLEAELARIRVSAFKTGSETPAPVEFRTLTLVEDAVMDREIVLREIGRRHETRAATAVLLLGQRFGVLAGSPALDAERLPVGPQAMCRIFMDAAATLELDLESQLLLFRTFDHKVMMNYHEWAETLNQFLSQAGVLPGLIFMPRRVRAPDRGAAPARQSGQAGSIGEPRPLTAWQGQATPSWHNATTMPQLPADSAAATAPASAAPAPPGAHPSAGAAGPGAGDEGLSFASLQHLLSMHRAGGDGPGGGMASGASSRTTAATSAAGSVDAPRPAAPTLGGTSLSSTAGAAPAPARKLLPTPAVLDALKSMPQAPPAREHGQPRRRVQDLQESLLQQVRDEHGPQAALANADADTFELLGLLYDQIEREVQQDAPAADLLVQLQVPVIQAALQDREFFLRAQHPARELLNTVAESGATWLGQDETDPHLVQKLHEVVNDVLTRYDGNDEVFEQANQSVQQHLQTAARKAELAERRHVEAARGKDRLEIAKQRAAETIETALSDHKPQKFVQALLNQAWADVLTLTLLRNGDRSDEWHQQLQTTLQIAAATTATGQGNADPELAARIEKSLSQVGYHDDEAAAIARRLSSAEGDDEATSRTELTARLKARTRLGEQTAAKKKAPHPRTAREQECYDHLRTLPFGTWFEFAKNQQGDVQRQRLSWFSPTTGNALFVNQRGQRVGEHSLDYIAHMMAQGQAQVVTEDKGRLIDRAWNATLNALRSLTGNAKTDSSSAGGAA